MIPSGRARVLVGARTHGPHAVACGAVRGGLSLFQQRADHGSAYPKRADHGSAYPKRADDGSAYQKRADHGSAKQR